MSPLSRWLICTMTAALLLLTYANAHGQDAPFVPPRKPSAVEDRLRQAERRQLDLELERNASPQIALYADVFSGVVDSGSGDPFAPDNPRAAVYTFTMPANVSILLAEVVATSASDLDLFLGIDANMNGLPDGGEIYCYSLSSSVLDWCALRRPVAAQYWVVAYSYRGSDAPPDSFRIDLNAFGSEVKFTSSAALEDGKYAHIGETITFTIDVQPPLPRSTPLSYTLAAVLPDGLQRVVAATPDALSAPRAAPDEWSLVTSGAAMSVTYQAIVEEHVEVDTGLSSSLTYVAGDERHGQTTTDLYVLGVALQITVTGAPTAPTGATAPYTVTVTNQGVRPAENLTVTVDLPGGVEHIAGGALQDGQLLWWIDNLAGGTSVELAFGLRLAPEAAGSQAAPPRTPRIVGGEEAEPGAWPWQVALWDMESNQWWGCGGSLIGLGWVLTAAHCVTNGSYVAPANTIGAAIGRHHLHSAEGIVIGASAVLVHPLFDRYTAEYDVALLHLATPATLGENVALAPLATVADAAAYAADAPAVTTGWGTRTYATYDFPEGLYQVELQMYGSAACKADYIAIYGWDVIRDSMICAGIPAGGKDACQGDSGGPLVVRDGARGWLQVGITSWGYECGTPNAPGVYSRIPSFVDWIKQEMHTVRLDAYAVTDGTGLPGHAASGTAPIVTTFVDVFSSVWVPIIAGGGNSQQ